GNRFLLSRALARAENRLARFLLQAKYPVRLRCPFLAENPREFTGNQVTEFPSGEIAERERADLHTLQLLHTIANQAEHSPDLVLTAFRNDDFVPCISAGLI